MDAMHAVRGTQSRRSGGLDHDPVGVRFLDPDTLSLYLTRRIREGQTQGWSLCAGGVRDELVIHATLETAIEQALRIRRLAGDRPRITIYVEVDPGRWEALPGANESD